MMLLASAAISVATQQYDDAISITVVRETIEFALHSYDLLRKNEVLAVCWLIRKIGRYSVRLH